MKRLTTKLISVSKITTSSTSISRNFTTQLTSSSSSISSSPIQKPYKTHQFHKNPSQNYNTHAPIPSNLPSRQRKINIRLQIEEIFEAAESAKEMLEVFKVMEGNFDERDLGLACLKIGLQLKREGEDYQKILSFANRALAFFDNAQNKCTLPVAMTLQLLGSTNCSLNKFNDALGFLNRANNILGKLEYDCKYEYGVKSLKTVLNAVYMELAYVEARMGRSKEAVDYLRKSLGIKKFLMGVHSREFANANRDFAEACVAIKKYKEGLLHCLKAGEIRSDLYGYPWEERQLEMDNEQRLLGIIYAWMEEYEKALNAFKIARDSFFDDISYVIDVANVHIALGRYEAALNTLKEHVNKVEEDSENPLILMTMANDLVYQENFTEAKRCLEIACRVFDKNKKSEPLKVADQFETMNEIEAAISFLLRTVALLKKLPKKKPLEAGALARMGSLPLMTDKATQTMAIPYLERAVEIVKEIYGSKHFGLGYRFNDLGKAYLVLERPEWAAEMFAVAKDILDFSLGPHHDDSIHTCQNLSNAYAAMKSYLLAIAFQQKAVDAWEGQGCSGENKLREARQLLEQLKVSARGAASKNCPTEALPVPHSDDASGSLQAPELSSSK